MAKINTLLFDLDGTLVDSVPDLAASVNFALRAIDHPSRDLTEIRQWIGNGVDRLLHRAITGDPDGQAQLALHQLAKRNFDQWYSTHYADQTRLYEGAIKTLTGLVERGFKLGCVTNKPAAYTRPLLAKLDIDRLFRTVIGGDSTDARKPDPLPVLTALKELNSTPAQSLMVGDSVNDFEAGRRGNLRIIMVDWGYSQGTDIGALGADRVISHLTELLSLLGPAPSELFTNKANHSGRGSRHN